ncbi:MAG TPA: hypothetical protein VEC12_12640 [Bacteroidia bacterium]|nr:hypothetical protein [Bacteroidia bacterium]
MEIVLNGNIIGMPFNHKNRKSIRLKGYDYSRNGLYFITICSHNREYVFGEVVHEIMHLTEIGSIADGCWQQIPAHFQNAKLHEYVIMPNHIHGILELTENPGLVGVQYFEPDNGQLIHNRAQSIAEAQNIEPLRYNQFQKVIPGSIASIIRGFKIGVTKWARNNMGIETVWQRNFYEHIIRNEQAYINISEYIINNPANWDKDRFYT